MAENQLMALCYNSTLRPSGVTSHRDEWGTDGSMIPSDAGILDHKSVTAAVTGRHTVCLKLSGRNISILHGELMGLITGLIVTHDRSSGVVIHTDHLNSVRLIDDSCTTTDLEIKLCHMNACFYYRWLLNILTLKPALIKYTKGHADVDSVPSVLNSLADRHAVDAQFNPDTPYAPIPTFFMDEYTLYNATDGWIESNARNYIERRYAQRTASELELSHGLRLRRLIYDLGAPPEFLYL